MCNSYSVVSEEIYCTEPSENCRVDNIHFPLIYDRRRRDRRLNENFYFLISPFFFQRRRHRRITVSPRRPLNQNVPCVTLSTYE